MSTELFRSDVIHVQRADRTAVITLDRPDARNALSRALLRDLRAAAHACDTDDDVDVIVLTGADPAFCAGLDLKELGAGELSAEVAPEPDRSAGDRSPVRGPLTELTKPVIGAVNGVAVTGGLELALACDFLVASESARFADTHARVGVMPGWGLTVLLPQAVGLRRAREMSTTGNYIDARTALEWGLVNHVVPHAELLDRARALAEDICSNDQRGVRRMLQTYRLGSRMTGDAAWRLEGEVAQGWHGDAAVDPAEVERRRRSIVERGRTQSGAPPG